MIVKTVTNIRTGIEARHSMCLNAVCIDSYSNQESLLYNSVRNKIIVDLVLKLSQDDREKSITVVSPTFDHVTILHELLHHAGLYCRIFVRGSSNVLPPNGIILTTENYVHASPISSKLSCMIFVRDTFRSDSLVCDHLYKITDNVERRAAL